MLKILLRYCIVKEISRLYCNVKIFKVPIPSGTRHQKDGCTEISNVPDISLPHPAAGGPEHWIINCYNQGNNICMGTLQNKMWPSVAKGFSS